MKMPRKTKYMTGLSIVMLVLFSSFAVPTIILGINIGKNYSSVGRLFIDYAPGEYHLSLFHISPSDRININIDSSLANDTGTEVPIVFSIMDEATFNVWVLLGEPEPAIVNSTYYTKSSEIDIWNLDLDVPYERTYYFIIYNNNLEDVQLDIDIELIPWASIIGVSVPGFLFSVFLLIFLTKIISTAIVNGASYIKGNKARSPNISRTKSNAKSKSEIKRGGFCQSCGAPVTPKDGQYCPSCGASV
jgi:hypothetical protein